MDLAQLHPAFAGRLDRRKPIFDADVRWPLMRLRQRTYVGKIVCPTELVTSARAVVFKTDQVVVVRQRDGGRHVEPGGRLERGETIERALRRELLEETGWQVGPLAPLGMHHFSPHDEGRTDGALGDFLQPLFIVEALFYQASSRDRGQIEKGSRLTPIAQALKELPPQQARLLRAAIRRRPKA